MVRWLAVLLLVATCSRASDEGKTKQWQTSPPPKGVAVPEGLSIAVDVDGGARPPITSATLEATRPDFVDEDHRAWRIATLVADAAPGTTVEAAAPTGVTVKFALPLPDGVEPVLFLTRRGEVIVAALDAKDPFPKFHGQGSRLRRPGDSFPHVAPVARIAITRSRP